MIPLSQTIPDRLDLLDEFLRRSEARFSNIKKNCEKKIVWRRRKGERTGQAIVYIHGFSASRMEVWPLCERLAESLDANLFYTRLSGHGQDGPALGEARLQDWLADALEAVTIGSRIGEKVILVGTSTGATLATWMASQEPVAPLIQRLILLSPNFFPKNPLAAAALSPSALGVFERLFGGWRSFSVINSRHAHYWTARYPVGAIATMMRLVLLSWRIELKHAAMPVLMMVNPWDRVINVSLAAIRFRGFPSSHKRLVLFRGNRDLGRHVLAGDILSPQATPTVLAVIRDFLKTVPSSV
jgi:pimeloyl-ACP methyl ester carboxylesterase